jgi:hypothetical protein
MIIFQLLLTSFKGGAIFEAAVAAMTFGSPMLPKSVKRTVF